MSYRSLSLPQTNAMPRQLILARTASICTAAIMLPGCTYQIAFGAAERSRLRIGNQGGMRTLWVGESAFDLLEAEAKAAAQFFDIPLPVLPAMAGTSLPSPAKAAAQFFDIPLPVLPAMAGTSLPSPSESAMAGAFSHT